MMQNINELPRKIELAKELNNKAHDCGKNLIKQLDECGECCEEGKHGYYTSKHLYYSVRIK